MKHKTIFSHTGTPIFFLEQANQLDLKDCVVIADQFFKGSALAQSLKNQKTPIYWVKAGESLKDLKSFPAHLTTIEKLIAASKSKKIAAIGGGSIGDFAGFIASIFHRGIPLIQIPTTYLAALDSAHGGKTGLNAFGKKNQIGSFYQAQAIYIVKDLLPKKTSKNRRLAIEAWFELIKIAMLSSKTKSQTLFSLKPSAENLWLHLPFAIKEKYRVVALDPHEKQGLRRVLNFGHTIGHIVEVKDKLPHGLAVGVGLRFALTWSFKLGLLSWKEFEISHNIISAWLKEAGISKLTSVNTAQFLTLLKGDKKSDKQGTLVFVFLRSFGKPELKEVTLSDVCAEAKEQGIIR